MVKNGSFSGGAGQVAHSHCDTVGQLAEHFCLYMSGLSLDVSQVGGMGYDAKRGQSIHIYITNLSGKEDDSISVETVFKYMHNNLHTVM